MKKEDVDVIETNIMFVAVKEYENSIKKGISDAKR